MLPKVCIGITTFNRASVLKKSIQSALDQNYENKEVFVVDDGSTDETPRLKDEFPQVRWHRSEATQGLRNARNLMMSTTDADLFCSLDDDSWFLSADGLSEGVKLFEGDPQLGAVGFEILDQSRPTGESNRAVKPTSSFFGCGHLLRLSVVRTLGYYHNLPGEYGCEEKDLSLRMRDAGFEVVELRGVHVWHDKTFQTRDVYRQHFSGVLNDLAFALHRAPLSLLFAVIPLKILSHLRFAMGFGLRDFTKASDYDRRIRTEHGRFAFLAPTIHAVCTFAASGLSTLRHRHPVSVGAFLEFIARGRQ
jgi:glycosyltransferase involved in cell wall biosynthesis